MARLRRIFAASALSSALALVLLDCAGGAEPPHASGSGRTRAVAESDGSSSSLPSSSSSSSQPLRPPNVYARLNRKLTTVPNAFSPDGRLVGLTSGDQCSIWDVATGLFRGPAGIATCEAWQQEGARRHDPKAIVACKKVGCGGTIALSPKGDEVAVHAGSGGDPIRIFDAATAAKKRELPLPTEAIVVGGGRVRLFWNDENLVAVSEVPDGGHGRIALFHGGASPKSADVEYVDQATRLTIDPFGWLVLSHEQMFAPAQVVFTDRVIGLARKTRPATLLDVGPPPDVKDDTSDKPFVLPVARASFSADGRVIGLASGATIVRSPKVVVEAARTTLFPRAAVVSPDGSRVAFLATEADESRTNRVLILQRVAVAVGEPTAKEVHLPEGEVTAIEWSGDGRHVALRSSARLEIRDAETGAVEIFWARVAHMAWGSESTLAVEQEGRVQMRDLVTRAELFRLPIGQKLVGRALSSAGDVLVTQAGGKITAWNATTGKRASEVPGPAKALAVSSDGKLVVVGTTLGDVTVYETESGKKSLSLSPPPPLLPPSPSSSPPRAPAKPRPLGDLAFVGGGTKEIAAVDVDGRAVVWERSTGRVVSVLPRRVSSTASIAPTGDFFVDDAGDLVRTSDELAARVRPRGIAMTGGCISTFVGEAGDAGVGARKAAQKVLASDLALLFGDVVTGVSESGAVMQDVLDEPRCAEAFFSGGAAVASALLADPRPPPAVSVGAAARVDGGGSPGSILVPIHIVDRAESPTVVTIEHKAPAPNLVRWQLERGGTPPEGRAYTMNVPADAGTYYSASLTVSACNAAGGGLCALPVTQSVSVSLH